MGVVRDVPVSIPLRALVGCALVVAGCEPPTEPPSPCAPVVAAEFWIEELAPLSASIVCASGAALPIDTALQSLPPGGIGTEPLPAGLQFDPLTGSINWTPGLHQAAVYDLQVTMTGPAGPEQAKFVVGVADAFDHPNNVPVVDPVRYREEFGLPVFFLAPGPADANQYGPTTIVYRGRLYIAEGKKRGASSLAYPKNSYTLDFPNNDRFHEPEFGFDRRKKVVLTTTFDDNSYLRQRLAFTTWNEMNPDHLAVQVFSAVVFVDGKYVGLYLASDHVDEDLAAGYGLSVAGNVYKSIHHDANFTAIAYNGRPKSTLHQGYEKKDGLPAEGQPGAFSDLDALVQWVIAASASEFRADAETHIHLSDFIDWWILVTLIEGGDSAGKNAYLYHDPAQAGGWRYVPWDFNHSFGQDWLTQRVAATSVDSYKEFNRIFALLLEDPTTREMLRTRYAALLGGTLSEAAMSTHVDAMWAEIEPAARRDWKRWSNAYQTFSRWVHRTDLTDLDAELAYLRQWIRTRWQHLGTTFPDR